MITLYNKITTVGVKEDNELKSNLHTNNNTNSSILTRTNAIS